MSSLPASNLCLTGSYDLSKLTDLRADLMRLVDEPAGEPVHLDLQQVDGGDVGFVQLLLSFQASLSVRGRDMTAQGSDAVRDLFRRAGASLPGLA